MARDACANYNAFGRDPHGLVAHLAGWFFGPDWIPPFPRQVFVGRPEPPRYGPPAAYQLGSLPPSFLPNPPPEYFGRPTSPFIDPPPHLDLEWFDAVTCSGRFAHLECKDEDEEDEETEIEDEGPSGDEGPRMQEPIAAEKGEVKDAKVEPKGDKGEAREGVEPKIE